MRAGAGALVLTGLTPGTGLVPPATKVSWPAEYPCSIILVNTGPTAWSQALLLLAKLRTMGAVAPSGQVFCPPLARRQEARPLSSVLKSFKRPISAFKKPERWPRLVHW